MARTINRVTLYGYTADEPVIRAFQDSKVANITIVTNESTRNSQTGNWDEVPEWHRVVAWGRLADVVANYVHKGQKLYVEGRLKTHSYTDNSGVKRKSTEIIASEVIFGESRRDGGQGQGQNQNPNGFYNNGGQGGYGQTNNNRPIYNDNFSHGGANQNGGGNGQYLNGGNRFNGSQGNTPYGDWNDGGPQSNPPYGSAPTFGSSQGNVAPQEPVYQGIGSYQPQPAAPVAPVAPAPSAPADTNYKSPWASSEPAPAPAPAAAPAPAPAAAPATTPAPAAPASAPVAPAAPVQSADSAGDDDIPF